MAMGFESPALRHFFLAFSQVKYYFLSDNVRSFLIGSGEIGQSLTCESILASSTEFSSWTVLGDEKGHPLERMPFELLCLFESELKLRVR